MSTGALTQVNYDVLDRAKGRFIEASRRTLTFAQRFGFLPDDTLGASANLFALDLRPFLQGDHRLYVTLVPEGLGTADDARPDDLSPAEQVRFWRNIGIKTVAVMTNDAASSGMQPILTGLYLPSSTPALVFSDAFLEGFLDGFVEGCRQVGCVYFSGETPELRTKIVDGRLDIAGSVFGLLPPGIEPLRGADLAPGYAIILVESSGPHENGYTALRKLAEKLPQGYRTALPSGRQYWEGLNAPSILYTPFVQKLLLAGVRPASIEPISGHGWQKLMRHRRPLRYRIQQMLPVPEIFSFVEKHSGSTPAEMISVFNYGAGLAVYVPAAAAAETVAVAKSCALNAIVAGRVEDALSREVVVEPLGVTISGDGFRLKK